MTGTSSDLLRALELFRSLCDLGDGERAEALERLRADEPQLAIEVEALLAEDAELENAADPVAIGIDRGALAQLVVGSPQADEDLALPASIGSYRVVALLGAGGMGVVYEAEQESPRRRVAVKVVHPSALAPARLKRLRREAEILGRLEHPGIARIYEAGTDDFGAGPQPFFAMEFVEGLDLLTYARKAGLDRLQRLRLFVQVCDAIDHAHRQGVLHRDLKPDNVLIEADGRPKVLDFGVARLDGADEQLTSMRTDEGRIVGTLAYMSPEQARGVAGQLGPETDVYSLGVMLFELLSGATPHDLTGCNLVAALQVLQGKPPARLGSVDLSLRGDLELICAKALEYEPGRRYGDAGELATDVRRHIENVPIYARPTSAVYELRKFVRRNRIVVAGTLSTVAMLVLGLVVSTIFALRAADRERDAMAQAYVASISAARADLRAGDPRSARAVLSSVPPDRRGWEWRYLMEASEGTVRVLARGLERRAPIATLPELGLFVYSRGSQLVVVRADGLVSATIEVGPGLVAMTPRGSTGRLGLGFDDGRVVVLDLRLPDEPVEWAQVGDEIETLRWTTTGDELTVAGERAVWSITREGSAPIFSAPPSFALSSASVDRGRETLLAALYRVEKRNWVSVQVIDLVSGELLDRTVGRHSGRAPTLSPAGDLYAAGTSWGNVDLIDPYGVRADVRLGGHSAPIRCLEWSPNGSAVLSVADDRLLLVQGIDGAGGPRAALDLARFAGDEEAWNGRRMEPEDADAPDDGVASNDDFEAIEPGIEPWGRRGPSGLDVAVWTDEERILVRASDQLLLWDLGGEAVLDLPAVSYRYTVAFSPTGRWLVSCDHQNRRQLWDTVAGAFVGQFRTKAQRAAFSEDGVLVTGDTRARDWRDLVTVAPIEWDAPDRPTDDEAAGGLGEEGRWLELVRVLGRDRAVQFGSNIAIAPGGRLMVHDGTRCTVSDGSTGELVAVLEPRRRPEHRGVTFSPDGKQIAWASGDVQIHDARTGRELRVLDQHGCDVYAVAYSPDGTRLATGAIDGSIILWDTASWSAQLIMREHALYVRGLAWSPDGTILASASGDGTVRLWDSVPYAERMAERERAARRAEALVPRVRAWLDDSSVPFHERIVRELDSLGERDDAIAAAHRVLASSSGDRPQLVEGVERAREGR